MKTLLLLGLFLIIPVLTYSQIKLGDTETTALKYIEDHSNIYQISDKGRLPDGTFLLEVKEYINSYPKQTIVRTYTFKNEICIKVIKWIPPREIGYILSEYNRTPKESRIIDQEKYEAAWISDDNTFIYIPPLWFYGSNFYALVKEPLNDEIRKQLIKSQNKKLEEEEKLRLKKQLEEEERQKEHNRKIQQVLSERINKTYSYSDINSFDFEYIKTMLISNSQKYIEKSNKEKLEFNYKFLIKTDTTGNGFLEVIDLTNQYQDSLLIDKIKKIKINPSSIYGVFVKSEEELSIKGSMVQGQIKFKKSRDKIKFKNSITPSIEEKIKTEVSQKNDGHYTYEYKLIDFQGKESIAFKELNYKKENFGDIALLSIKIIGIIAVLGIVQALL